MILVTGSTGTIGSALVQLLHAGGVCFRVMARQPLAVQRSLPNGIEVVQGDFDEPSSLAKAVDGVSAAFLVSAGRPDAVGQEKAFIDAMARAGKGSVVKISATRRGPQAPPHHAEIESHIAASGVPATIIRPVMFMQNILGMAKSIEHSVLQVMAPDAPIGLIDARDIAAVAAEALQDSQHIGKRYVVTSDVPLSYRQMADILGTVLKKNITVHELAREQLQAQFLQFGMNPAVAAALVEISVDLASGESGFTTTAVKEVTGQPPRTFANFVQDHAHLFAERSPTAATAR